MLASKCASTEADKVVSAPLYSVLNAEAFELLKAVCVAVGNLVPNVVANDADILASSPKAAANSFNVFNVPGAESTNPATFASV